MGQITFEHKFELEQTVYCVSPSLKGLIAKCIIQEIEFNIHFIRKEVDIFYIVRNTKTGGTHKFFEGFVFETAEEAFNN